MNCPHCQYQIDIVQKTQADVKCPSCGRFFLWIPSEEDSVDAEFSEVSMGSSRTAPGTSSGKKPGLLDELDVPADPEQNQAYIDSSVPGQKKRNMYPYELPGQTMEADRRMPVYSSMMADAYRVLEANPVPVFTAMVVFSILIVCAFFAWALGMNYIRQIVITQPGLPGWDMYAAAVGATFVLGLAVVWIFNGQVRYLVELLRYGTASTGLLFKGTNGLFRSTIVWLIFVLPLAFSVAAGGYFLLTYATGADAEKLHQLLGWYYPNFNMPRVVVGASVGLVGVILHIILVLYLGLSYWLIVDKDLPLFEALSVSVKITKEKKGTFLGILVTCLLGWLVLSVITFGVGLPLLFPVVLLFIAMYYMKTAIQEMVIPGKSRGTIENPYVSLYDNCDNRVYDEHSDEQDIL